MEIERKFLIKNDAFNLDSYDYLELQQAYISTSPVIRVRQKLAFTAGNTSPDSEEFILTVKSKGMLSRQEFELKLEPEDYKKLLTKAEGNIITKRRYIIPLEDGLILELDYFKDLFDGLVMGEIEFPDEEAAHKYNLPSFILREVTYNKSFHNSNMSSMSESDILNLIVLMH